MESNAYSEEQINEIVKSVIEATGDKTITSEDVIKERNKRADTPVGPKVNMQGKAGTEELKGWRDTKSNESKINEYVSQLADYLCVKPLLTAKGVIFKVSDEHFEEVRSAFISTGNYDSLELKKGEKVSGRKFLQHGTLKENLKELETPDGVYGYKLCPECGSKLLSTGSCANFNCKI